MVPKCVIHTFTADISSKKHVEKLFEDLAAPNGPGIPDVLVNNAGSAGEIKMIAETDVDKWWFDSVHAFLLPLSLTAEKQFKSLTFGMQGIKCLGSWKLTISFR